MPVTKKYKHTLAFMHRWGNKVVVAIKNRIRRDDLIDTGALLNSISYNIEGTGPDFELTWQMGDGEFNYSDPATVADYGVFQDQGTIFIKAHYFFSAPIPGLTQKDYIRDLKVAAAQDEKDFVYAQVKEYAKQLNSLNTKLR